jgi:fructokinase
MTRIVVAGEALIDRVIRADGGVVDTPGGGPYNTARTMARLGADVAFLGRISTDDRGERLHRALADDGVALDHVVRVDDRTTMAVATLDASGAASYRFDLDGTSAAGLAWADLAATGLEPTDIEVLHVGTLGLLLEPSGTTIERLVDDVRLDALVMLDPNARPSATPDPPSYRARIRRLAARADVIKVSVDDLRFLDPDGDAETALAVLLGVGTAIVLLTDGPAAVEIVRRVWRQRLPVPRVDVVDSVGAGDAFGGGFLATWVRDGHGVSDLADEPAVIATVGIAIEVAALTCQRAGADPPTRAVVDARLAAIAGR